MTPSAIATEREKIAMALSFQYFDRLRKVRIALHIPPVYLRLFGVYADIAAVVL